jgi:hypothetical protein
LLSKRQNLLGNKNYGCVVFSFFLLLESLEMARLLGVALWIWVSFWISGGYQLGI